MVLLGKKTRVSFIVMLMLSSFVCAEEVITVQATPKVQAANLSPIENSAPVVKLPVQQEQIIRVQTAPVNPVVQSSQSSVQKSVSQQNVENKTIVQPAKTVVVQQAQVSQTTPTNISFDSCVKMFPINAENLFVLTLGAIEANGFTIKEIQSQGGYITFFVQNKEFLATVAEIDNKNAMLKINPTNGVYHFAPGIISKMFEYIDYKLAK